MSWGFVPAGVMFLGGGFAVWAAIAAFGRRTVPGHVAFGWAQLAIALWAATAGLDFLVVSLDERVALSQVQYLGITALPVCWLLFAGSYTQRIDVRRPVMWWLWLIPAVTVAAGFTNSTFHLLWTRIIPTGPANAIPIYVHGPMFWADWIYANVLLATGTWWMILALRHYPAQFRAQALLLVVGVITPWVGNLAYIFGLIPIKGLDATPLGFAITGVCFAVGLFRYQLFELVPVARSLLFNSITDAVFVVDPSWHLVDANGAARALARGAAIVGRRLDEILPWWPQAPATAADVPAGDAAGRNQVVETDAATFDITQMPVFDDRRTFIAWLVLVRDVTERVRAEAARVELERRLLEQQRVESLSVLADGLAHDFNNFLQGVVGNAQAALHELPNPSDAREAIVAAIASARRAVDVAGKMRAYSGNTEQASVDLDLAPIVAEMVSLLRRSAARRGTLRFEPPGRPVAVTGDPTQIRQVMLNLIVNAAEASGAEPCAIVVRLAEDRDPSGRPEHCAVGALDPARGYARLEVQDAGSGMDAVTAAHIFDPFFSTKASGRGLGLAAVQSIVKAHRGAIQIDTEPGRGTTFRVWLPLSALVSSR